MLAYGELLVGEGLASPEKKFRAMLACGKLTVGEGLAPPEKKQLQIKRRK